MVEQLKFVICAFSLNVLDLFGQPETETWTFSKKTVLYSLWYL